ncbi:MAG: hypothetical protein NTV30_03715 [Chloroflexi bacterium]|nr:hypothetical protein [Chloroflexota bacterium]
MNKIRGVNYFGTETIDSDGRRHSNLRVIRGNGDIELTETNIVFTRWFPKKKFIIPIETVIKTDTGKTHNSKTSLFPILKIYYKEGILIKVFGICVGNKEKTLLLQKLIENFISK